MTGIKIAEEGNEEIETFKTPSVPAPGRVWMADKVLLDSSSEDFLETKWRLL